MCLNKVGGIKDVSHKFLVMCKSHVADHPMKRLHFCIYICAYPNICEIAQIIHVQKERFAS